MNDFNTTIERIMSGEKALSYSAVRQFLESPKHYKQYVTEQKQTDAMLQGIAFHMACLEPEEFKKKYWCLDDAKKCEEIGGAKPRSTKAYKEWSAQEAEKHEGQKMLKVDEYNLYMKMRDTLMTNKATKPLMEKLTKTEFDFEYEHDGFKLRGKVDGGGVKDDVEYIIDLKKTANAKYDKVKWKIRDDKYDMQGGLYSKATNIFEYYLIFIDSDCNVQVVKICKESLEKGFANFDFALSKFEECAETDSWDSSYEFFIDGDYIIY